MSEFLNLFCEKNNVKEKCYIISSEEHDGKSIVLSDALECCKNSYMAMILISEKFVLVKEEYEKKGIFLLSK